MNIKDKYTIIETGGFGWTTKREIEIKQNIEGSFTFALRGKRKQFYIKEWNDKHTLLFIGWDLPLKVDSETGSFVGNACLNFVTDDAEHLKQFILSYNLNKNADIGLILYRSEKDKSEDLKPLFIDKATETAHTHAVIRDILFNLNKENHIIA